MKKILYILFFLSINAASSHGENGVANDTGVKGQPDSKDECLLVAINCGTDYPSLERKIDNLRKEISKGKTVYTDDELNILRGKLDNATKTMEFFRHDGARNLYKYPGD
jgi:hypothetical protein